MSYTYSVVYKHSPAGIRMLPTPPPPAYTDRRGEEGYAIINVGSHYIIFVCSTFDIRWHLMGNRSCRQPCSKKRRTFSLSLRWTFPQSELNSTVRRISLPWSIAAGSTHVTAAVVSFKRLSRSDWVVCRCRASLVILFTKSIPSDVSEGVPDNSCLVFVAARPGPAIYFGNWHPHEQGRCAIPIYGVFVHSYVGKRLG